MEDIVVDKEENDKYKIFIKVSNLGRVWSEISNRVIKEELVAYRKATLSKNGK